jgi:hypothetical protein
MSAIEIIGVISGIIGILSFVFAVWVWQRSDFKVKEMTNVLQSIYEISSEAVWTMHIQDAEDTEARFNQAQQALGIVTAIQKVSAEYSDSSKGHVGGTELRTLLERGIIWTTAAIDHLERSEGIKQVWIVTPDLEPDTSDQTVGSMVKLNLQKQVRYVFFHPDKLHQVDIKSRQLLTNIGVSSSQKRLRSRVSIVPVSPAKKPSLFHRGNTVLYFKGDPATSSPHVFEEVVFTKVAQRGVFWQECDPSVARDIQMILSQELYNWNTENHGDA